ncbi:hypothetical protein BH11MYX3_BH11MYX3_18830 [soil metagenome]
MASDDVPTVTPDEPAPTDSRVSVMEWLLAVGDVIARKARTTPGSPMLRIPVRRSTRL